jgi:hypothetical protein
VRPEERATMSSVTSDQFSVTRRLSLVVIAGLDPAIHAGGRFVDARIKSGHDEKKGGSSNLWSLVSGL